VLIRCPWCGARDHAEYFYGGDAAAIMNRPAEDADLKAWHDYVYLRDNPRGPHRELWQHNACREWLVVTRDTLTHEVLGVVPAHGKPVPGAGA
jgi:heterotetrameric sarcosine oxidase delta subunit